MKVTSAQAAKMLRTFNQELATLQNRERRTKTFVASLGEDPETLRPEYNYEEMKNAQLELEQKIRKLKHALNIFNSTTVIPEFGITIDEMLIYLPQLTRRCHLLSEIREALPKIRIDLDDDFCSRSSNIIDYKYTNYDITKAADDYTMYSEELLKAQTALDVVNNTIEFELDI